ncbi:MAG: GTP pyrophosphokinase family protein [Clostridiales bacterium]|jgi:putative GTP pyrophosphokinase|nr:GTP pyrophosphokinase family protein [Clostridiales bacterium]
MSKPINWDIFLVPYQQAVDELVAKFRFISEESHRNGLHSPVENVYGRVKNAASIMEKASRKNIPLDEVSERMEDIAGVRVICRFVEDIERVAGLIRRRDGFDLSVRQERDYIKKAKPSGYQSYHMLVRYTVMTLTGEKEVWAEIQIRTLAMNFWSTIEHSLKYKYSGNIPEPIQKRLQESAAAAHKLDMEMSKIHDEIIEAQNVKFLRDNLANSILKRIGNLYFTAHVEEANELHRQFISINQSGGLEELQALDVKITTLANMWKVNY